MFASPVHLNPSDKVRRRMMVVLLLMVVVVVAVVEGKAGRHSPPPHLISSYVIPARVEIACMYG